MEGSEANNRVKIDVLMISGEQTLIKINVFEVSEGQSPVKTDLLEDSEDKTIVKIDVWRRSVAGDGGAAVLENNPPAARENCMFG